MLEKQQCAGCPTLEDIIFMKVCIVCCQNFCSKCYEKCPPDCNVCVRCFDAEELLDKINS